MENVEDLETVLNKISKSHINYFQIMLHIQGFSGKGGAHIFYRSLHFVYKLKSIIQIFQTFHKFNYPKTRLIIMSTFSMWIINS